MSETNKTSTYKDLNSFVSELTELSANVAKLSVIISLPVGVVFLISYLRETSAPFPALDASFSVLITLITATFGIIFFVISSCVVGILFITSSAKTDLIRRHLPNLRSDLSINKRRVIKGFFGKVFIEYITLYIPFLLFLITYSVLFYQNQDNKAQNVDINALMYATYSFAIGVSISFIMFSMHIVDVSHLQGEEGFRASVKVSAKLTGFSFLGSLVSIMWFIAVLYTLSIIVNSDRFGQWSIIFLAAYVMVFHFMANSTRIGDFQTYILMIIMLLSTSTILIGLPTFTAISLRTLGIGGGVPSTITVRTVDSVNGRVAIDTIRGCIIISTSSQVSIQPTNNKKHCSLNFMLSERKEPLESYEIVDVYSRSDILKISKW